MYRTRGYTLFELLIILSIISIFVAIAAPSLKQLRQRIETVTVIANVEELLNGARIHALINHQTLTVCGSRGTICDNDWTKGILVFRDVNRNGVINSTDELLNYVPLNIQSATLAWRGFGGNRIVIEHTGTTFASNGSLLYCPNDSNPLYIRQIVINRGGRVRHSRDTNQDGIHEDANGNNLICP